MNILDILLFPSRIACWRLCATEAICHPHACPIPNGGLASPQRRHTLSRALVSFLLFESGLSLSLGY